MTALGFDRCFMRGSDEQFNSLRRCSDNCISNIKEKVKLNFIDKFFGRTKTEKAALICNYKCVRNLKLNNCKYNGRWIFMFILGFTEISSSICALIKFIMNVRYFKKVNRRLLRYKRMRIEYFLHHMAMSLAFLSSFLFHLHETILTRNLDYFTAVFSIVMNAAVTTQRNILIAFGHKIGDLHLPLIFATIFYSYHLYRMTNVEFNYIYNMTVCGILIFIIQVNYFVTVLYYRNKTIKRKVTILTNLSLASALFELSDFPPLFYLLDSHFLWHVGLLLSIKPFYKFTFLEAKLAHKMSKATKNK